MKKKGAVISGFAGFIALAVLMAVFVRNASPYVTVAEARSSSSQGLHVAGQIEKGTIVNDLQHSQIRFTIKDDAGQTLPVVYKGAPVSNLGTATKVVAIGGMTGNTFTSDQLLVKCPSRYTAEKAAL